MEADDGRLIIRMQISEYILINDRLGLGTRPRAPESEYDQLILEAAGELANSGQDEGNDDLTLDTSPLINGMSTCAACTEQFPPYGLFKALCPHWYCHDCINQLVVASIQDPALHPPRCCNIPFELQNFRHMLSNERAGGFERRAIELADPEPLYCPYRHCGRYISQDQRRSVQAGYTWMRCPACQQVVCLQCRNAWHAGACRPDVEEQNVRDMVRQEGGQECPNCHRMFELSDGCNHITCRCLHEFCFLCTARWRTCQCPHYSEDRWVVNRPREQEREQRRERRRRREAERRQRQPNAVAVQPVPAVPINLPPIPAQLVNRQRQPVPNLPLNVQPVHALPAPVQPANLQAAQIAACQHKTCQRLNGVLFCNGCEQTWPQWVYECNHCHQRYCAQCRYDRNGQITWFDPEVVNRWRRY